MTKNDVTRMIERLEALEDRVGVRLDSLSAFFEPRPTGSSYITLHGEIHAADGTELRTDVTLLAAAYDDQDRVVGTSDRWYQKDDFYGLDIFDITISVEAKSLKRIRVFPKRRD